MLVGIQSRRDWPDRAPFDCCEPIDLNHIVFAVDMHGQANSAKYLSVAAVGKRGHDPRVEFIGYVVLENDDQLTTILQAAAVELPHQSVRNP